MGLNTVSVVGPKREAAERRREKRDPMDDILKGLTIANQGFGIAVNYQRFQQLRETRADDEVNRAHVASQRDDARDGIGSKSDHDALMLGGKVQAAEGQAGAVPVKYREGDEVKTSYLIPKEKEATIKPPQGRWVDTVEGGRPVKKFVTGSHGMTLPSYEKPTSEGKKENATTKRKEAEYQTRINNIHANIAKMDKLIEDDGTFDLLGAHNDKLAQTIQDIAVDYAKVVDPDSVARESEVESAKKMLQITGLGVRNSTARDSLANFKDQMETRMNSRRVALGYDPLPTTKELAEGKKGGPGTALADEKRILVSNGKGEEFYIPEADLAAAAKDGFKPKTKSGDDAFNQGM